MNNNGESDYLMQFYYSLKDLLAIFKNKVLQNIDNSMLDDKIDISNYQINFGEGYKDLTLSLLSIKDFTKMKQEDIIKMLKEYPNDETKNNFMITKLFLAILKIQNGFKIRKNLNKTFLSNEEIFDYYFNNQFKIKCEGCGDEAEKNYLDFLATLYCCSDCYDVYCKSCVDFSISNSIGCINCKEI